MTGQSPLPLAALLLGRRRRALGRLLFAYLLRRLLRPCAAIAYVSSTSGDGSFNATFGLPGLSVTAGNWIVVCTGCDGSVGTMSSVTDTVGTSYTKAVSRVGASCESACFVGKAPTTNAANVITLHPASGTAGHYGAIAGQYSGVNTTGNTGTGTTNVQDLKVSVTTHDANNFAVACYIQEALASSYTAVSGTVRAQLDVGNALEIGLSDNTAAAAGTVTNEATYTAGATGVGAAVELRVAAGGLFRAANLALGAGGPYFVNPLG